MANDPATMPEPPVNFILKAKRRDGWWVITSDDIPGLCVAHQDMDTAFGDIALSIRTLARLNAGVKP